ncbi:MAG: GNAT family N-acetyltransferase [Proteocatella sp.]
MKTVTTKKGYDVVLRQASHEDAEAIIAFYNMAGAETTYLSFCGGEYRATLEQQKGMIDDVNASKNNTMLLAKKDNEIIGIGTITSNQKIKGRHVATLGIVITQKYCNIGVGKVMMDDLISWCRTNHITKKISLVTAEENHGARALYEKCGFETEGILKNEICIDGKLSHLVAMGLMI